MADTIIAWTLLVPSAALVAVVLLFVLLAGLVRAASRRTPAPTNAAQASAPPTPALTPARAREIPPALRVHLCTRQCGRYVNGPGQACFPTCESPVHDAERVLRQDGAA